MISLFRRSGREQGNDGNRETPKQTTQANAVLIRSIA